MWLVRVQGVPGVLNAFAVLKVLLMEKFNEARCVIMDQVVSGLFFISSMVNKFSQLELGGKVGVRILEHENPDRMEDIGFFKVLLFVCLLL